MDLAFQDVVTGPGTHFSFMATTTVTAAFWFTIVGGQAGGIVAEVT